MLLKSVEITFLTFDARTGNPYVRINRGRSHGLAPGHAFLVFHDANPAGTLSIDTVLAESCAGLLRGGPPLPSHNQPMAVDMIPQNIDSPAIQKLIPMPGPGSFDFSYIQMPQRGARSINQPWRPEYDSTINAVFRAFAQTQTAPMFTPPPSLEESAPPQNLPMIAPSPAPAQQSQYRIRKLDPEFAREIKSGFFIEPGDCLNIAPWPGSPSGQFIIIDQAQTIELPGPRFVSTDGKSLSQLEKELRDLLTKSGEQAQTEISPCVLVAPDQNQVPE